MNDRRVRTTGAQAVTHDIFARKVGIDMFDARPVNAIDTQADAPGFDYEQLDADTALFIRERTERIRELGNRASRCMIDIGQYLTEVKARLGWGHWLDWLEKEFAWTDATALNFTRSYNTFGKSETVRNLAMALDPTALYKLAAPSTPETAREEILAKVKQGEITPPKEVKEIIARHKEQRADAARIAREQRWKQKRRRKPLSPEQLKRLERQQAREEAEAQRVAEERERLTAEAQTIIQKLPAQDLERLREIASTLGWLSLRELAEAPTEPAPSANGHETRVSPRF